MITIETPIYNHLRNKYLASLEQNADLRKSVVALQKLLAVQENRINTLKKVIEIKDERIKILESDHRS